MLGRSNWRGRRSGSRARFCRGGRRPAWSGTHRLGRIRPSFHGERLRSCGGSLFGIVPFAPVASAGPAGETLCSRRRAAVFGSARGNSTRRARRRTPGIDVNRAPARYRYRVQHGYRDAPDNFKNSRSVGAWLASRRVAINPEKSIMTVIFPTRRPHGGASLRRRGSWTRVTGSTCARGAVARP